MCKCSLPRILNSGALCWASQGVAKAGQGQGWWPGPEPWCPGVEAVPGSAKERPPGGLPPSTPHGHHPGAHGSSLRQGEIGTKLKPLICKLRILGDVTISSPGFIFFFLLPTWERMGVGERAEGGELADIASLFLKSKGVGPQGSPSQD